MIYKVNWDNGNHACGTFPYYFGTYEEADTYGKNWVSDMKLADEMYDGDYSKMSKPEYTVEEYKQ